MNSTVLAGNHRLWRLPSTQPVRPRRSALAWKIALFLICVPLVTSCSIHTARTTPLWEEEMGTERKDPRERVNVWPLFYKNRDRVSILWPFIVSTKDGHAVMPFYDHDARNDETRVLTVHPQIPAGAFFGDDQKRVLNVSWDESDRLLMIFPLWFQHFDDNDGWVLLFPLYFHNEETTWNWLYTSHRSGDARMLGFAGPLFFHHKDNDHHQLYGPWPFVGAWWGEERRGAQLFPLGWVILRGDDESQVNLGLIFFHRERDGDDAWGHVLWPLGSFEHADGSSKNYLIPLYYRSKSEDKNHFLSLHYTRVDSEATSLTNVAGPAYLDWRGEDFRYRTAAFPLLHKYEDANQSTRAVFPLFALSNYDDDGWGVYSLPFNYRKGRLTNVFGPAFIRYKTGNGGQRTWIAWPFATWWRDEDSRGSWVFPLYAQRASQEGTLTATLLGGRWRTEEFTATDILGPLYFSYNEKTGERYRSVLFPLVHWGGEEKLKYGALFPLFVLNRQDNGTSFFTLPFSIGLHKESESWLNLGVIIAHAAWEKDRKLAYGPLWLVGWKQNWDRDDDSRNWLFPLWSYHRHGANVDWNSLLGLLGWYESDNHGYDARLLLAVGRFRDETTTIPARAENEPATYRHDRESRLFPLWKWKSTETPERHESEFSLLWRLFHTNTIEREGIRIERQRVLWKILDREAVADEVSVDAFPFLSWDRREGYRRFSWAGGLLETRREENAWSGKVFWIPIGG